MSRAEVYWNKQFVGVLSKRTDNTYEFSYHDDWYYNQKLPPVSLTMPKIKQVYTSDQLFPFFFNMLSEGVNKKLQCRQLKIDEKDHFSLLLATASTNTIGAITIVPINEAPNEHA